MEDSLKDSSHDTTMMTGVQTAIHAKPATTGERPAPSAETKASNAHVSKPGAKPSNPIYSSRIPPSAPELARNRETYASFGDAEGTTVSVNAYGNIMHIARFFGDGTVFQQYDLGCDAKSTPTLQINANLLIRNLDFVANSDFNKALCDGSEYGRLISNDNSSLVIVHKISPTSARMQGIEHTQDPSAIPDSVNFIMTPFADEVPQKMKLIKSGVYEVILHEDTWKKVRESGRLQITMAYRLELTSRLESQAELCVPHFAFEFLHSIFEYLNDKKKPLREYFPDSSVQSCPCQNRELNSVDRQCCSHCQLVLESLENLRRRIEDICERHLKWVVERTDLPEEMFSPHYWATGKTISDWQKNSWLPPRSLADTPLQLMKIYNLMYLKPMPDSWSDTLTSRIKKWIQTLDEDDKQGNYAFPRPSSVGSREYHLVDHVLIWQGLISAVGLGLGDALQQNISEPIKKFISKDYDNPFEACRKILKRFTTEFSSTKQRMLATQRTSTETRFMFHASDTVLLYDYNKMFFVESAVNYGREEPLEEWERTIFSQAYHQEFQRLDWKKPLYYALALAIASTERQISSLTVERVMEITTTSLLGASSANGLMPGMMTRNRDPAMFEHMLDRDFFWHTSFELPYALWHHGRKHLEGVAKMGDASHQNFRETIPKVEISQSPRATGILQTEQIMTKRIPFNSFSNLIERKGLTELSDGWILPGPQALNFEFSQRFTSHDAIKSYIDELHKSGVFSWKSGTVISTAVSSYKGEFYDKDGGKGFVINISKRMERPGNPLSEMEIMTNKDIMDALGSIRTVQDAKKRLILLPNADKETALLCYLGSPGPEKDNMASFFERHVAYDKYFFDGTNAARNEWDTELHLSFFRKIETDKRSSEGIPATNIIELENNISITRAAMGFRFVGDFLDRYWTCHFLEHGTQMKGEAGIAEEKDTFKAHFMERLKRTGSFKVQGGTDRRYVYPWQQRKVLELLLFQHMLEEMVHFTQEIFEWAREFMLETTLRRRLGKPTRIEKATRRTIHLTTPFKVKIEDSENPIAASIHEVIDLLRNTDNENYFSFAERWRVFEPVLVAVEDDIEENLERIAEWKRREIDRKQETPVWTWNDERRYGPIVAKLEVLNQRTIRELERGKASLEGFRESLTGRLASIREDISFRGSENINLFTYVTVVFVPLGFGSAIFSMGDPPTTEILGYMILTSIIALVVTVIALANARSLGNKIVRPVISLSCWLTKLLFYPALLVVRLISRFITARIAHFLQTHDEYLLWINTFHPTVEGRQQYDDDREEKGKEQEQNRGRSDASRQAAKSNGAISQPRPEDSSPKLSESDLESGKPTPSRSFISLLGRRS
ncbi:hypothetical protein SLS56_011088 [Neofusicoccum ribis]|uniref:Mg2+ transporter zinc transport protein n=1 Tax=Neofusicoccum ribis TaxID=45134 RepID=A0ABR3SCK6_9PEZI